MEIYGVTVNSQNGVAEGQPILKEGSFIGTGVKFRSENGSASSTAVREDSPTIHTTLPEMVIVQVEPPKTATWTSPPLSATITLPRNKEG